MFFGLHCLFPYFSTAQSTSSPGNILGELCITSGGTTLSVGGGTLNGNRVYQWGTGTTAGQNIFASGASATQQFVNPTISTTYWVRVYKASNGHASAASFATVVLKSTAPDYIQYVPPSCSNTSTTLNALGGTTGTNGKFQWGSGTIGSNIIAGAITSSITVTPSATTTYWVRRADAAPCNFTTDARTIVVNVVTNSVAPTAIISSAILPLCGTSGTTLYANGTPADGATYQWGTGNIIGQNVLSGQNSSNMWIAPGVTTTYWVRLKNGNPCTTYTNGVILIVPVRTYSITPASISSANSICLGSSITLTAVGGSLGSAASYQWGTGWSVGNNIIAGETGISINVTPTSTTVYWVRTVDENPCYQSWVWGPTKTITVTSGSSAPTSITGAPTSSCAGSIFTLSASGGNSAAGSYFQWATGNTGENILSGTTSTITVNPITTTKYWVRRYDPSCGSFTSAATVTVHVNSATVAGILSSPITTICKNTVPEDITLSGNAGAIIKWQSSNNATFSSIQNISNTSSTLSGASLGVATTTKYYRAVVQKSGCAIAYTAPIAIIVPPSITYSGTWSGELTDMSSIIVSHDLTISSDISVCSCKVVGNATLTVPSGKTLTVRGKVEVNPSAELIIENEGSLVQIDDLANNVGQVTVLRKTTPMRATDFTYWSSPVSPFTLTNVSPATKSDKFYSFNPTINNWTVHLNGAIQMQNAKGYIVRAPQGWSLTNVTGGRYTANFLGTANNGVIQAPIVKAETGFNLIGNPYPSAIDIDLFLTDPANENLIQGTIYLWTHNTAVSSSLPGNETFNYSADDYAKYNLTGGVKTASGVAGGVNPNGKIAVGQAFFIEANSALANGTYAATFNNSMRIAGQNDQFFRTANPTVEKNRIWLNISNNAGAYDEALVGYVTGATNGFDSKYDGAIFPAGNPVSIYSVLNTNSLAIQGRALPFAQSDIIQLGYTNTTAGIMTIALDNFDGLFQNQQIFLFDRSNGNSYDLKTESYHFTSDVGTFNNRFELRFESESLNVDVPISTDSDVVTFANDKTIYISSDATPIQKIVLYDLTGKLLFDAKNIDASKYEIPLTISNQLVVIKITLDQNYEVVRKVLIR